MNFGATVLRGGGTRFRLWAPSAARVLLEVGAAREPMQRDGDGWHELTRTDLGDGTRYRFAVETPTARTMVVPDPASRSNPDGVHAESVVVDPHRYAWTHGEWLGRPWHEAVVYELHVGCFTAEGTFAAARARLPELAALGITALQVMPLAGFAGNRNWGYDGVLQFAPADCYGPPDELKALIDAAHGLGLMVLLDVVYNHFGPEGNYLHAYCPEFFNAAERTPWGPAINFDAAASRVVREFFIANALYWTQEFRCDGLRLDAVHAMHDRSQPDIVCEIAAALRASASASPGRQIHLLLENNRNQACYLTREAQGAPRYATAQWDDDIHHALHVVMTGEADGYYADYSAAPLEHVGRSLAQGFAYQGEHSVYRGKARGEPSAHLPPEAFVSFLQNHDMIGNRAFGERIDRVADPKLLVAAYVCLLLSPEVPMLFMGEEYAAATPFLFFCDFEPDLAGAVARGRRLEFRRFAAFADEAARARIPDPNEPASFTASKLDWQERAHSPHAERLALIGDLLALRRRHLTPRLAPTLGGGVYRIEDGLLSIAWPLADQSTWCLRACFGRAPAQGSRVSTAEVVYAHRVEIGGDDFVKFVPGSVLVTRETGSPQRSAEPHQRPDMPASRYPGSPVAVFPAWLAELCTVSLVLGLLCALTIAADLIRRPSPMRVMRIVWPVCALFGSVLLLWFYVRHGRADRHGSGHSTHAAAGSTGSGLPRPYAISVATGTLHCGSGCAIGDIIAETWAYGWPGIAIALGWHSLFAQKTYAVWVLDFVLALAFGVLFQYFAIVPMRKLSPAQGIRAAFKADVLSLAAWQVGMYGLMAAMQFIVFQHVYGGPAPVDSVEFWAMMQLAMFAGFATSFPMNWWLIRTGIKERM
jgi:maltooligosyltrehalose trehalohydrolase